MSALVGNIINLRLFAKILGSMWASTPTDCAFIELCRRSSTHTDYAFIELCRRVQYSLPHLEMSDEYCLKQEPPLEARGGEPLAVVGI